MPGPLHFALWLAAPLVVGTLSVAVLDQPDTTGAPIGTELLPTLPGQVPPQCAEEYSCFDDFEVVPPMRPDPWGNTWHDLRPTGRGDRLWREGWFRYA